MSLVDFVVLGFAVWEAVEIWHHSEICAGWRAKIEAYRNWLSAMTGCPKCLSNWVSWVFVTLICGVGAFTTLPPPDWIPPLLRILVGIIYALVWVFVHGLAVTRLANLLNDYFYKCNRTKRFNRIELPTTETGSDDSPASA